MRPDTGAASSRARRTSRATRFPTWQDVVERDYHAWDRDRLVVHTAASDVRASVRAIVSRLSAHA
jgi:hypothetical protein